MVRSSSACRCEDITALNKDCHITVPKRWWNWDEDNKRTNSNHRRRRSGRKLITSTSIVRARTRVRDLSTWSLITALTLTTITFAICPKLALGMSLETNAITTVLLTTPESIVEEFNYFHSNTAEVEEVLARPQEPQPLQAELSLEVNNGTFNETTVSSAPPKQWQRPPISVLQWVLASIFSMLIVFTVIGNTLVILSVLTTRRLRTVTNCFVMSLAVADWLVGLFVMPPAVAVFLLEKWMLGRVLCDIWISLDVLLCTASILSLCAISIDRYLAVTQPLKYSKRRRSKRLAMLMILVVWILAVAITCPPMLFWYDSADRGTPEDCHYDQNKAYVVYSAMGSFFIPMLVMIYVYVQISCVIARRHDHMSEIAVHKNGPRSKEVEVAEMEIDVDNVSDPEPSSPRRTTTTMSSGGIKREVTLTSSGGSNTSSVTTTNNNNNCNFNKNIRNAQYELVDGTPSVCKAATHQQPQQTRTVSSYRNKNNCNAEQWYNSTSSSTNGPPSTNALTLTTQKTTNFRVHQKSMSNRVMSLKRENKTTQTLAIVVGGFILCWLPFFVSYLVTPFLAKDSIDEWVSGLLTWLGWFNSAMNPFIYALYSVDFRAAFWRLTCRRFCKSKRTAPPFGNNTYSIRMGRSG